MKPRIILIGGLWHCGLKGARGRLIGVGYSPVQAFQDWEAING